MEAFGTFGFILGVVAFMMAGFALSDSSQLRKEIAELRKRLQETPPTLSAKTANDHNSV